jgi:para-aminobenzoate synthetase
VTAQSYTDEQRSAASWRTDHLALAFEIDTQRAFTDLFGRSASAFWLDGGGGRSRFSFFGSGDGPWSETLEYRVGSGVVTRRRNGTTDQLGGTIFDVLEGSLADRAARPTALPLPFTAGYVGYLGYEVKADCGSPNRDRSLHLDATWVFADQMIAVDHVAHVTYVLATAPADADPEPARRWIAETATRLRDLESCPTPAPEYLAAVLSAHPDIERVLVRDRARYLLDVQLCLEALRAGDSYEICLTNTAILPAPPDPLSYYGGMRRENLGAYSSFLRFGLLTIASSSPECFLHIDSSRIIESRPIKGTTPRSNDPLVDAQRREALANDPKARSENLMIVDLLRNDLGKVCEIGSVTVPRLMAVETYANVHHLVSTIRGYLRDGVSSVRATQQCFPPGSMTGAPKLRSMEIIGELEGRARGPYSGVLGYFSTSGAADLAVVIRTAVIDDTATSIGAGGAIVLDSSPTDEFAEMLLKMQTPLMGFARA